MRPTSALIFRLVVSANCVWLGLGYREYITPLRHINTLPKHLQPPGDHNRHPPLSIPSAIHSRISVVTLPPFDSGVTPLYPPDGRSTRASPSPRFPLKHIESGLSPLFPPSRNLSQSFEAWLSHTGCFIINQKHSRHSRIGLADIHHPILKVLTSFGPPTPPWYYLLRPRH